MRTHQFQNKMNRSILYFLTYTSYIKTDVIGQNIYECGIPILMFPESKKVVFVGMIFILLSVRFSTVQTSGWISIKFVMKGIFSTHFKMFIEISFNNLKLGFKKYTILN